MKNLVVFLLLCAGLVGVPATATEFKAGFVSTERVLQEATIAKEAQKKLETEFSKREKH